MLRGDLYLATDSELVAARVRARRLCARFNSMDPAYFDGKRSLLHELLGGCGAESWVEAPFYCDYGSQIKLGAGVFVNFGAIFLDPTSITIGDQTQLGQNVQLLTADHPREPRERTAGPELARPIQIGSRVWLGGGVIVCPGVTIGDDTTIGAGSVVVRDIPAGVIAAGNPCRVVRQVEGLGARP